MFNFESIKEMMNQQFGAKEATPYLIGTTPEHCLKFVKYNYDISLMSHNIFAVHKSGFVMLFNILAPSRIVECYSFGNGIRTNRDVVDVFNMVQNDCVAWCEV